MSNDIRTSAGHKLSDQQNAIGSTLELYHVEYLAEQYEKLQNLAENKALIGKDKIETMRRAFKSYDKDGNGVLDREEIFDLLTNHFKEQGIKKKPTKEDVD